MGPLAFRTPTLFEVGRGRADRWEKHNAETLIALECHSEGPFRALEANLQLDRVHLALVRADHHRVDRSAALVESHPSDSIAIYAVLAGRSVIDGAVGRSTVTAGQVIALDPDAPFARDFDGGVHELVVKVPRSVLGDVDLTAPLISDDIYSRALIASVSRAVRRTEAPSPDEDTILDLVLAVATGGRAEATVMRRAAARAFVDRHFADADLSAADVAAGVGISERQLSRVFAAAGTSVPRYVLGRRLDAAYALLLRSPELTTGVVAARCGFTSTAHFSRSFVGRFGVHAGRVNTR
ncbi:AraC family transcriptional regulator [Rhodococcoides trifolii]|uniref:AraC family transcriptional regulator n=1 Tax=Rhodococcoides trifolii TaxID=908250 RepID=A0A917LFV4_9NOCA|nr:AraC family transcriptional regulator [Rhodococcus trifolii]GGG18907.1 AraC family transcriptional regulator [Rhodococcus trifolii]